MVERRSTDTMWTTNSGTSRMFLAVSFMVPSARLTTENARIGGDQDTPVKKLNGARFVWPTLLIDDTNVIARGIMRLWEDHGYVSVPIPSSLFPKFISLLKLSEVTTIVPVRITRGISVSLPYNTLRDFAAKTRKPLWLQIVACHPSFYHGIPCGSV